MLYFPSIEYKPSGVWVIFSKRSSQGSLACIHWSILDLFVILERFVCTLTVELACSKSCSSFPLVDGVVFLFLTVTLCIFSSSDSCNSVTVSIPLASGNRVVDSLVAVVVVVVVVVSSCDDRSSITLIVVDSPTLFVEKIVDESFEKSSSLIEKVDSSVVESTLVVDCKMMFIYTPFSFFFSFYRCNIKDIRNI